MLEFQSSGTPPLLGLSFWVYSVVREVVAEWLRRLVEKRERAGRAFSFPEQLARVRRQVTESRERGSGTAHPCSVVSSSGKALPRRWCRTLTNKIFRSVLETSAIRSAGEDGQSATERTFAGSAGCGNRGRGRGRRLCRRRCPRDAVLPRSSLLGGKGGGARAECRKREPGARKPLATRIARSPRRGAGSLQGSSLPEGLGESPWGCRNRYSEEIGPGVGRVPGCLRAL